MVLELIKAFFGGVGSITYASKDTLHYRIASLHDLIHIVLPHFDKYPLNTQKRADFILFKEIILLMINKEHLTMEGIQKIVNFRSSINLGGTESLKKAFPNTVPVERPVIEDIAIDNPYWFAGFSASPIKTQFINKRFVSDIRHSPIKTEFEKKRFFSVISRHKEDAKSLSLGSTNVVLWGNNLSSTVGVRFSRYQLSLVKLPLYIRSVIVGLVISDGWIIFENSTSKNALLGFSQSGANSIYAWFVFSLLSHYCSSYPIFRERKHKGKFSYAIQFKTRSMECITELRREFYPEGIKVIPYNIYELLTPVALAHIIMGDGQAARHGIVLCTNSFSVNDVVRWMNVLMIRYRLECTIHLKRQNQKIEYLIYIREGSMTLLRSIVIPFLHPSMYYKLRMVY